ncbi:hypothetical protein HZA76_04725 [Candidatus Roizmanbacteria bacterium]|nr:hypothetical protein [Candidatus Roizmanbacteria bacterium]
MKHKLGERILSLILSLNLVFNNLAPFISLASVSAQEVTPVPTAEPTVSPTGEPIPTIDVSPTEAVSPTVEPTQDVTPTPTVEVSPTVEVTPVETATQTEGPTLAPQEAPSVPSPPTDSNTSPTPEMSVEPSPEPTPTITPLMTPDGHVDTTVVESYSCRADSLNGCLTTDKNDYAPASVAIISGYGFAPNTGYSLVVSTDGLSQSFNITTDNNGAFTYSYSLYEEYHALYSVQLFDTAGFVVATTSFTDTPTPSISATAIGNYDEWIANTGTKVNAVSTNDGDTTYITNSTNGQRQSFTFSSSSISAGSSINSVTLNVIAKEGEGGSKLKLLVEKGSLVADRSVGSDNNLTGSYATYSRIMTTNPFTSAAWTLSEVNSWTVKFGVENGANKIARVTQIYLIVDYTDSAPTNTPTPTSTPTPTPISTSFGPISAQNIACMGDQPTAPDPINCTANDIQLASVDNIQIIEKSDDGVTFSPASGNQCDYPGQYIKFTASWHVESTAQSRYNVGLWFANQGQASALHGTCSASTLPSSPSPFFEDTDDTCGDIDAESVGTVSPDITVVARCVAAPGTNNLRLPYCTSWDNNEAAGNSCNGPEDTVAGTPSKCSCNNGFTIPIIVPFTANIEVVKDLNPGTDPGKFNLQVNGNNEASCVGDTGTTDQVTVGAGTSQNPGATHTVGETACTNPSTNLSDYATSISCVDRGLTTFDGGAALTQSGAGPLNVDVDKDDDIVCTITNTVNNGTMRVHKVTDPSSDTTTQFSVTATGSGTIYDNATQSVTGGSYVDYELQPGTYDVAEASKSGWNETGNTCNDVVVPPGQTAECTITNTQRGHIIVDKVTDPSGESQSFDFTATGTGYSNFSLTDQASPNNQEVVPGSYTVSEGAVEGWDSDGGVCDNGEAPNSIDVGAGETITCTFTNTQRGSISGYKYEDQSGDTTDSGDQSPVEGLLIELWRLVTGTTYEDTGLFDYTDSNGYFEFLNIIPGVYQLREILSSLGAAWTNVTSTEIEVTVDPGESDEDNNFINTQYGTIVVEKQTVPDGDQTSFDFDLSYGDNDADLSDGQQDSTGNLLPGSYSVSENTPVGWDLTSTVCTSSIQDTESEGGLELDSGETITCVFTNTKRGSIIVEKQTTPNGATGNFTFTGDAAGTISDDGQITVNNLVPGQYTSTENDPTLAFDLTNITCDDTTNGGTASTGDVNSRTATFNVGPGETVKCTFTNTQRGSISGVKYEDADGSNSTTNDRSVLSGWVIELWKWITNQFVYQTEDTTDVNGIFSFENLLPGIYQLREQLLAGWTKIFPVGDGIDVTVDPGESDDENNNFANFENVSVTACKQADADGNINTTDDRTNVSGWQIDLIKNGQTIDDTQVTGVRGGCYTWSNLGPGNYSVSEETQIGWTNLNPTTHNFGVVQSGNTYSHTFVNTQFGSIRVVKETIPDGSLENFEFNASYHNENFLLTDGFSDLSGDLLPGTYSVSEIAEDGWNLTSAICDDGSPVNAISLQAGETVVCTFTNTQRGHIIVDKVTNPAGAVQSFNFDATGSSYVDFNLTDLATPNDQELTPGTYSVSETVPAGWDLTSATCTSSLRDTETPANLELDAGETINCTFTNTELGNVIVIKYNDHNGNGIKDEGDEVLGDTGTGAEVEATRWEIHLVGTDVNSYQWTGAQVAGQVTFSDLLPNSFTLSEQIKSGWDQTNIACEGEEAIDDDNNHPVNLAAGQDITCYIGNQGRGSITVNKNLDTDGTNGADVFGYTNMYWELDSADHAMGSTVEVGAGSYGISEVQLSDYHFTSLVCKDVEVGTQTTTVDVAPGEDVVCTYTNTRDTGTIVVHKIIDVDGDPLTTEDQSDGEGWEIDVDGQEGDTSNPGAQLTEAGGLTTFPSLKTGNYNVSELLEDGYGFVEAYCDGQDIETGETTLLDVVVDSGDPVSCTFINTPNGSIHGQKWNDLNGDGIRDFDEPVLGGWRIFLDENDNQIWDDGEQYMFTDNDQELGWYWFEHLFPGTYTVCEEAQAGWVQTSSPACHVIEIPVSERTACPGPNQLNSISGLTCDFGNQQVNPTLQISKSNDASGDKGIGDLVIYTLKVKAIDSQVLGVILKDLLPNGFSFQSVLSIIRNGSDDITASVGNPNYASPGTYNLGDMNPDDEIIIKYTAKIGSSVDPGLYKDVAYAFGKDVLDNRVLALAQPEGFVSTNFVGTSVNVNATLTQGGNIEIGEVLGASTSLPATGGNALWVILASILSFFGLIFMVLGLLLKKKNFNFKIFGKALTVFIVGLAFVLVVPTSANAANLSVRLEQPKSPTSKNDFKITYTVLDLTESPAGITVKCFKKGPSDGGYSQFGSDIAVAAGGNSGDCANVPNFVNTNGTYQFYATANNGSETATSESEGIISVGYNTQGDPTPPSNYKKEKISSCQYRITFRTADDGLTTRVEIYRSENTSFNLDGGTRVGDISIGPNQDGTFEEAVPDCNKTYYYVIRSFNSSGNPSGPVGDSAVTVGANTTTEGGAIPVEGVSLPGGGTGGGEVLGEEAKEGETTPTTKPEVVEVKDKGVTGVVKGAADFVKKNPWPLLILIVVVVGLGVYVYLRRKNQSSV